VLFSRRRNRDSIDCRIGQRLGPIADRHLVFCGRLLGNARARIDNCHQGPQPGKIAY
jgi:hypothetical protein